MLIASGALYYVMRPGDKSSDRPASVADGGSRLSGRNGPPAPWTRAKDPADLSKQAGSQDDGPESDSTPILDQWMESNWEQDDAVVIEGLLVHAGRADLGLAEKSRALEHALNLLPDTDYQKLDNLLSAPATSPHLLQQVFTDLHNRSERASLHASLRLLARPEPEVAEAAKGFLAHWVNLDDQSDTEAIRLQAEARLLELEEEPPPPEDQKEQDPKAPIPPGLRDAPVLTEPE